MKKDSLLQPLITIVSFTHHVAKTTTPTPRIYRRNNEQRQYIVTRRFESIRIAQGIASGTWTGSETTYPSALLVIAAFHTEMRRSCSVAQSIYLSSLGSALPCFIG
jgi:hypothetical protein